MRIRSIAPSKSSCRMYCWSLRAAKIAASFAMFARSAPVSPAVRRASMARSTSAPSGFERVWTRRISSRPCRSGGETFTWRSKRPGRSSAGSRSWSRLEAPMITTSSRAAEAVELDEELVQRLVVLAVVGAARAGAADGVELVDEDDRRRVLARLLEELADARRAEAGEHLDERRGARRVEVGARLVGGGLREQRLAGARWAVEQDPLRDARAEPLELLAVAEELDDLLELLLRLVRAGDVVPADGIGRVPVDHGGLHLRHERHRAQEQPDDDRRRR